MEQIMATFVATFHWLTDAGHWTGDSGILQRIAEHGWYVSVSIVIATVIGVPAGIFLGYRPRLAFWFINLFNAGRAIPSLGLILLFILLIGFTDLPVFIALIAMSLPPIVTNTYAGIYHADKQLCDAARAMGMTGWQSLTGLRLPLAMPLIFSGFRTALLQLIATAVIAAYAGAGGLGRFLIDGLGQQDVPQIISGAFIVSVLAIVCDMILLALRRLLFRHSSGYSVQQ